MRIWEGLNVGFNNKIKNKNIIHWNILVLQNPPWTCFSILNK